MGRPRTKEINFDDFEKLCMFQCTLSEIAAWFQTTPEVIKHRVAEYYDTPFSEIYEEKTKGGHISLKRAQWKKAIDKGDNTMLIWLGKQYLNQSDGRVTVQTTENSRLVIDFGDDSQNDSEANS